MLAFAREGVVPVHGLGLPGRIHLDGPEDGVVDGGDGPAGGFRIQPGEEDEQGVVSLGKRMSQEGALSGTVVAVADVAVLETDYEGFFVNDLHPLVFGGAGLCLEEEGCCSERRSEDQSFVHIE